MIEVRERGVHGEHGWGAGLCLHTQLSWQFAEYAVVKTTREWLSCARSSSVLHSFRLSLTGDRNALLGAKANGF